MNVTTVKVEEPLLTPRSNTAELIVGIIIFLVIYFWLTLGLTEQLHRWGMRKRAYSREGPLTTLSEARDGVILRRDHASTCTISDLRVKSHECKTPIVNSRAYAYLLDMLSADDEARLREIIAQGGTMLANVGLLKTAHSIDLFGRVLRIAKSPNFLLSQAATECLAPLAKSC